MYIPVIGDINDENSNMKNIEALKKVAIDYWFSVGQETYKKIDSILAKETLSTSNKRKSEVAGDTSSEVEGIGGDKKKSKGFTPGWSISYRGRRDNSLC
jgi:hypothetical protein